MLKPVFALTAWLSLASVARAAEPAPRVVLLDAVVLPPTLEQTDLRSKVQQAVADAARAHGWEPVSIATDCHDLGCAGAVARSAKAFYVMVLIGKFVATDTYAAASASHFGTMVRSSHHGRRRMRKPRGAKPGQVPYCAAGRQMARARRRSSRRSLSTMRHGFWTTR